MFETVLTAIWAALNTPAGVAAVAGAILWLLNRIYAAKPAWRQWEGTVISAVKWAEKQVPDDSPNKGLSRLDCALKYALSVYESTTGKPADGKTVASLKEGIQITHAELEAAGNLDKAPSPPAAVNA